MPTLIRQGKRERLTYPHFPLMVVEHDQPWKNRRRMEKIPIADEAPHILVVDDDDRIRLLLQKYLSDQGLRISTAENAAVARKFMETLSFDLLVVDIMMPGEDGLSLTTAIRETSDVPILMLTAKSEIDDRISGLETGADDYVSKPFEPRELLLRINSILKRAGPPPDAAIELVCFGPFTFNLEKGELRRNDNVIKLTDREKEMMRIFCKAPGETVPRYELLSDPSGPGERTVDVQINRLRRKIEVDPTNPLYLHTVRGIGYRILTD